MVLELVVDRPHLSVVVTGRNDDYGGGFADRLLQTAAFNVARLMSTGLDVELVFVEWNPLAGRRLLSYAVLEQFSCARAFVVSADVHELYSRNPAMSFHEMPAKNVGIRHARGEWIVATNADVLIDDALCTVIAGRDLPAGGLYRARRIDLAASTPWELRDDPAYRLPSGEGRLTPSPVLGAAGDFCLAHRALWNDLRGYDERIRFSTRAKDWQFFLSASQRGIPIRFIGTIYHLEHGQGFQNTDPAERESSTAHFGGPWDIEYGLPVENEPDWGLADCRLDVGSPDGRLTNIAPSAEWRLIDTGAQPHHPETESDDLTDALAAAVDGIDEESAVLMHAIWHVAESGSRLLADLAVPGDLVKLAGFAQVAAAFDVAVRSQTQPPSLPGHITPTLLPWPAHPDPRDIVIRRRLGSEPLPLFAASIAAGGLDVQPKRRPAAQPAFDPLLARRLLRAWFRLRSAGASRIALLGAGGHTAALLRWGLPDRFEYVAVLETSPRGPIAFDLPCVALEEFPPGDADAILISSLSYEPELQEAARLRGWRLIIPMYGDDLAETVSHEVATLEATP
jgi:hypothetical protein